MNNRLLLIYLYKYRKLILYRTVNTYQTIQRVDYVDTLQLETKILFLEKKKIETHESV